MAKQKIEAETAPKKFTKEQILASSKYRHNQDLLSVILEDDNSYTFEQVDTKINTFLKGKVK